MKTASVAQDIVPDAFGFAAQTQVAPSTDIASAVTVITGITGRVSIRVVGGEYSVSGGPFTSAAGTVGNGDSVRVKVRSSSDFGATTTATLTIGSVSAAFSVTTVAADTLPDAFAFATQAGVAINADVVSNAVTVAGVNTATPIAIYGGEYAVNGGPFTSATGTVQAGDSVRVRVRSSSSNGATTAATLAIGGVSATFAVTTLRALRIFNSTGADQYVAVPAGVAFVVARLWGAMNGGYGKCRIPVMPGEQLLLVVGKINSAQNGSPYGGGGYPNGGGLTGIFRGAFTSANAVAIVGGGSLNGGVGGGLNQPGGNGAHSNGGTLSSGGVSVSYYRYGVNGWDGEAGVALRGGDGAFVDAQGPSYGTRGGGGGAGKFGGSGGDVSAGGSYGTGGGGSGYAAPGVEILSNDRSQDPETANYTGQGRLIIEFF
jgi:hypothetical protein